MSRIFASAAELIGKTPLLELGNIEKNDGLAARLLVKLESRNPAGSAKDRVALAMVADAERRGLLSPALPSSSPPPATPASVFAAWPPPGATAASSLCPTP